MPTKKGQEIAKAFHEKQGDNVVSLSSIRNFSEIFKTDKKEIIEFLLTDLATLARLIETEGLDDVIEEFPEAKEPILQAMFNDDAVLNAAIIHNDRMYDIEDSEVLSNQRKNTLVDRIIHTPKLLKRVIAIKKIDALINDFSEKKAIILEKSLDIIIDDIEIFKSLFKNTSDLENFERWIIEDFAATKDSIVDRILNNAEIFQYVVAIGGVEGLAQSFPDKTPHIIEKLFANSALFKLAVLQENGVRSLVKVFPPHREKIVSAIVADNKLFLDVVSNGELPVLVEACSEQETKKKILTVGLDIPDYLAGFLQGEYKFYRLSGLIKAFPGYEKNILDKIIATPSLLTMAVQDINELNAFSNLIPEKSEEIKQSVLKTELGEKLLASVRELEKSILEKNEKEYLEIKSALKASISAHSHPDSEEKSGPVKVTAPNFKESDQVRYLQFWQENIPNMAVQFREISQQNDSADLAYSLYAIVAQARENIAAELRQNTFFLHTSRGLRYGVFRKEENGRFRDAILQEDVRFGRYFAAMKNRLEQADQKRVRFVEAMISPAKEDALQNVELSDTFFIDSLSEEDCSRYKLPNCEGKPGIILLHVDYDSIETVFKRLNLFLKEILAIKVDSTNQEKLWFLLGNIMWYLGNCVPLQAGSAATTENFIKVILEAKGFSTEDSNFRLINGISWDLAAKVTDRLKFVAGFPQVFDHLPQPKNRFLNLQNVTSGQNVLFSDSASSSMKANTNNPVVIDENKIKFSPDQGKK